MRFPQAGIGRAVGLQGARGAAGTAGAGGVPSGWHDVTQTPYNADPTGAADCTTAINSLLTFLKANGGTGYFPPGTYKVTGVLNGDSNTVGYTLQGAGGGKYPVLASKINFTGTGAVNGLTLNSTLGIEVCYLWFNYTGAMTGNLVQSDGSVHSVDSQYSSLHHCAFSGPTTPTTNAQLMLNQTNVWNVHDNYFSFGGTYGLQMGPGYVVNTQIDRNLFAHNAVASIGLISNDCEACVISNNTFEELGSPVPTPVAIQGSVTVFNGGGAALVDTHITNNWFGDVSASTTWINQLATWSLVKTCSITYNHFGALSGGTACCYLKGAWLSQGNVFDGIPAYDTSDYTKLNLVSVGDSHIGVASLFPGATRPSYYVNIPSGASAAGTIEASLPTMPSTVVRNALTGFSPNNIVANNIFQFLEVTRGSGATVTIQAQSVAAFPIGGWVDLWNSNATTGGNVLMAASGTASILPATIHIVAGGVARVTQVATDVWAVTGQTA